MADLSKATDGPSPLSKEGYDESLLPDFDTEFLSDEHLQAFAQALSAPEPSPSTDDLLGTNGLNSPVAGSRTSTDLFFKTRQSPASTSQQSLFITAQHDGRFSPSWVPG